MVAIAELTKIPIATLLFSASWLWKPIVFIFLVALAGITFETVFMGLERAVTLRQYHYEEIVGKIADLKSQDAQVNDDLANRRNAEAARADRLKEAQEHLTSLSAQADSQHKTILGQIAEAEKNLEGKQILSPDAARIRDAISVKTAQRDRIVGERDNTLKNLMIEFERQRDSYTLRMDAAEKNHDADSAKHYRELLDKLGSPRTGVMLQYAPKIEPSEKEIASLEAEFTRKQEEAAPMSTAEHSRLEATLEDLKRHLGQVDTEWQSRLDVARGQVATAQDDIDAGEGAAAADQQQKKAAISEALKGLNTAKIDAARSDQVRRIAARFYGSKPEEVTNEQAGFISVVWFGSMGMLAALAGPLTAIVALALQKIASSADRSSVPGKLSSLVRRMLLHWRWKRVRSVKVPIEVPVDREVEKRVEVPVERIIKEILYVPILTDDPDALRRAMNDTLPREIADLVSVSYGGAHRAGAA